MRRNLQRFVVLEDLLNASCACIVFVADDVGVEDSGGGVEGIHGRVDAQLGNT